MSDRPRWKGQPMISSHALNLIHAAIDGRRVEDEQRLITYVAYLEDAAPLLPTLQAEAATTKREP